MRAGELAIQERLDVELDRLPGRDEAGVLLLDRGLELERIHLHDGRDRHVLADVFAGLDQPFGDRPGDRRPDHRVGDLLLRQLVRRAPILQAGLQAVDGVERGLIVGLGDLRAASRRVSRSAWVSRPRPLNCCACSNALRASSRFAVAWRIDAIWSSAGGCLSCSVIDAELRLDLAQSAFGAVERQLQLARVEPRDDVAGSDLGARAAPGRRSTMPATSLLIRACSGEVSVPDRSTSRCTDIRWTGVACGRDRRRAAAAAAAAPAGRARGLPRASSRRPWRRARDR